MRHWPRTGAEAPPHLAVQECECGSLFIIFSSQRGGGQKVTNCSKDLLFFLFFFVIDAQSYAEGSEDKMRSGFLSLGKKEKEKKNE